MKEVKPLYLFKEDLESFLFDNTIIGDKNKKIKTIIKEINNEFTRLETIYDEDEIYNKFKEEIDKSSYQYIEKNFYDVVVNADLDKDYKIKYDIIVIDGYLDEDITIKKIKLIENKEEK
jgi:hypothetical protein